jgi:VanZ family protein
MDHGNGLKINSITGLRSTIPAEKLYNALLSGDGITVEVWVAAGNLTQGGPARIVSYSFDKFNRNFTLGQERGGLVMRLRTTNTDLNGKNPHFLVPNIFSSNDPQHIAVTYDYSIERAYLNGSLALEKKGPGGNFSVWDPSYHLILANEITGNRPWLGEFFLVAIYNRALSAQEIKQNYRVGPEVQQHHERVSKGLVSFYSFIARKGLKVFDRSEFWPPIDLQVISCPVITGQAFLAWKNQELNSLLSLLKDLIGNIVIFLPVGFLLYFPLRQQTGSSQKTITWSCAIGLILSLNIEMLQYFSLVRMSSLIDVVTNTLGAILGSLIANQTDVQFLRMVPKR